jgi:lysozyme
MNKIEQMIKRHEGFRDKIYFDSLGFLTIGYGHALLPGSKFPQVAIDELFKHDFAQALQDYDKLGFELDEVRKACVVDMLFNLGIKKLRKFSKMLFSLGIPDYKLAAKEMRDSAWYYQVGHRAEELALMMETGEWQK